MSIMHSKLTLDLTGITYSLYSLWEVSVAVGLEDSFLCGWILGLRILWTKIQERLPCKKYLKDCLKTEYWYFAIFLSRLYIYVV